MPTFHAIVDFLASPPWLFGLALLLFLAAHGAKLPWTLSGGLAILVATAALLAAGLRDDTFRRLLFHPERFPVAVLLLATAALLWLEMHRCRGVEGAAKPGGGESGDEPARWSTRDLVAATLLGLALITCAHLRPAPLGDLADPSQQPLSAKAPWFLVGLQELSLYFDPWVAYGALPILFLAGLLGLPFLETPTAPSRHGRALFLFGWLFLWLLPMAVGAFLRGPEWRFFGPFEPWSTSGPAIPEAVTLAQAVWTRGFHLLEPERWWLRELPGLLLLAAYFVLLPILLTRFKLTRSLLAGYRDSLGGWRFYCAAAWVLAVAAVPLKMYGRWLWGIGYWVHLPELSFSF